MGFTYEEKNTQMLLAMLHSCSWLIFARKYLSEITAPYILDLLYGRESRGITDILASLVEKEIILGSLK